MIKASAWRCEDLWRALQPFLDDQLPAPDRLRALAHIDSCPLCAARVERWDALSQALRAQPRSRPPADTDKLWRAINTAVSREAPPVRHPLRWQWPAAIAASLALATGFALSFRTTDGPRAHVEVMAAQDTVYRRVDDHHFELTSGRLRLDVTGLVAGEMVTVCTDATCTSVYGTAFSVSKDADGERVEVEHGVVAVAPKDAPDSAVALHRGETLHVPWVPSKRVVVVVPPPPAPPAPPSPPAAKPRVIAKPTTVLPLSADALADAADRAYAGGNTREAEALWLRIVNEHAQSPECDSAAYQLGRAAVIDGRIGDARRYFEDYLRRHPTGVFVEEARRGLKANP